MAERVGFEPTDGGYPSTVFKTAAFDHSATSPTGGIVRARARPGKGQSILPVRAWQNN